MTGTHFRRCKDLDLPEDGQSFLRDVKKLSDRTEGYSLQIKKKNKKKQKKLEEYRGDRHNTKIVFVGTALRALPVSPATPWEPVRCVTPTWHAFILA